MMALGLRDDFLFLQSTNHFVQGEARVKKWRQKGVLNVSIPPPREKKKNREPDFW